MHLRLAVISVCLLYLPQAISVIKRFGYLQSQHLADEYSHCIGIACSDGVLIGSSRSAITSTRSDYRWLQNERKVVYSIGSSTLACAGISADMDLIVRIAKDLSHAYKRELREDMSGELLAERLAEYLHEYNAQDGSRALRVAMIIVSETGRLMVLRGNGDMHCSRACTTLAGSHPATVEMMQLLRAHDWTRLTVDQARTALSLHCKASSTSADAELSFAVLSLPSSRRGSSSK